MSQLLPPHRVLDPPIYPGLLGIHGPMASEPNWMLEFGWFELSNIYRPGWVAICETHFDLNAELSRSTETEGYHCIRRGRAVGDHCPVEQSCDLAVTIVNGVALFAGVSTRRNRP